MGRAAFPLGHPTPTPGANSLGTSHFNQGLTGRQDPGQAAASPQDAGFATPTPSEKARYAGKRWVRCSVTRKTGRLLGVTSCWGGAASLEAPQESQDPCAGAERCPPPGPRRSAAVLLGTWAEAAAYGTVNSQLIFKPPSNF